MATIHELDRTRGLDLFLHTPGGDAAATESLVDYLRQMFGTNIRAIVPQLAMSAGTMIALSCKEILMGKHSNLGPIDPQFNGTPAHGIIDEFERAQKDIQEAATEQERTAKIAIWQPLIAKYTPALIGECQNAINWSSSMVAEWLRTGMFEGDEKAAEKAATIVDELSSHEQTKTHARHIHRDKLKELGVKVVSLEEDSKLQDAVLTVHHACVNTLTQTPAVKIIENQNSMSFIVGVQLQAGPMPFPFPGIPPIPMRPNIPGQPPVFPNVPGIPAPPNPQGEMTPDQGQE